METDTSNTRSATKDDRQRRRKELLCTAIMDDLNLPVSINSIIDWEDAGYIVNLITGEIYPENGGAS